jgi:tetratricopeptide (TPR) repeat protein
MAKGAMELAERLLRDVIAAQRVTRAARVQRLAALRHLAKAAEGAGHPDASLDASRRAGRLATGSERAEIAVDRVRILTFLGRYRAGLAATTQALRTCSEPTVRGHLLLARARIRNYLGQWKECLSAVDGLLADRSASADPRVRAQAHVLAEWCCSALGLPQRAAHAVEAEGLLIELDDSLGLANLYLNRGISAWNESRGSDAVADFEASSERYKRAGYVLGSALADNNLAEVLTLQMRLDAAERLLTDARRVTNAANYPLGTMITVSGLSRVAAWRGDVERGHGLQREALAGFRELGADDYVADSLVRLVEIAVISENWPGALEAAEVAAATLGALGEVPVLPAMLCRLRGRTFEALERTGEARVAYIRAIELSTADHFPYEVALASIGLGRLEGDRARIDSAMAQLAALDVLAPPPGA